MSQRPPPLTDERLREIIANPLSTVIYEMVAMAEELLALRKQAQEQPSDPRPA